MKKKSMNETMTKNFIFLTVNTANVLDDWRVELESFYETRGTRTVMERLYTNNAVMIIGNSGIGKTATMRYVSLLF